MAIKEGNTKFKKLYIGSTKFKKVCIGSTKLWSGASTVYYYDGYTLKATREVDEGLDVLHPNFSTYKSGYTLVGWSTSRYGSPVSELTATGDTMYLYALYVPNTRTVLSAHLDGYNYVVDSNVSGFYSGQTYAYATTSSGSKIDTQTFNIIKNYYRRADISLIGAHNTMDYNQYFDGSYAGNGTIMADLANGAHTLKVNAIAQSGTAYSVLGIGSLVLSDPKPWV